MLSLRSLRLAAAAAATVLAAGLWSAAPANAGGGPLGSVHGTEGPAGAPARMPDGRIAAPPDLRDVRAASRCPVPPAGPQFYAPGRGKTVALTFDDGPGKTSATILQILRSYKVPATFFNIGQNMAARPALIRAEARAGFVLGNHTWSHPDLTRLTRRQQAVTIDQASAEQASLIGSGPCVFRPPYGNYNRTTLSVARYRRLEVWLWSVDTEDWKAAGSSSARWVNRIIRLAEQEGGRLRHPVVLMHNQPGGNPATALALPTIIKFFRSHHYAFVALTG